jgi:hypothetical protein|tara:strand:- start:87 stop:305 length:219 start_codon:yes stop_codon:yes gene_type:complete
MSNTISVKLKLNVDKEKLQELKTVFIDGRFESLSNKDFLSFLTEFCLDDITGKCKDSFGIHGDNALTINLSK